MIKSFFVKTTLKLCLSAFVLMFSFHLLSAQTINGNATSYQNGTHGGYFYSFWFDQQSGSVTMTLGPEGNYSTQWSNAHNFTAGKGWETGSSDRVVCFEGTYDGGENGFLALYGWTRNPMIEYYICEKHGRWQPPGNTGGVEKKGQPYQADGGTYQAFTGWRENAPSIDGTSSFAQYWSVREQQRSSGTITFADHIAAWKARGMDMGSYGSGCYQIMESEGYMSSGSSNITISECTATGLSVAITGPDPSIALIEPAEVVITADASSKSGSITKVEFYNGSTRLGEATGSPYSYTWEGVQKGTYKVTAIASDNQGNTQESAEYTIRVNMPQGPYGGTPHAIPGKIEFEEYDEGGNGNAYFDTEGTQVDPAPNFRTDEDVDIETCTDDGGGYNLGWTAMTDWTEYTVNVEEAGKYTMILRVACEGTGKSIKVESVKESGNTTIATVAIDATGGWQEWANVEKEVELEAGEQVLRFSVGGDDYINMNYVTFKSEIEVEDLCPTDPDKTAPGECGCNVPDIDEDKDGVYACNDQCDKDPNKTEPGECGCGVEEGECVVEKIQLYKGWNLIGYPNEGSADIQTALSSIWSNVITVKDLEVFYSKENPDFLNLLDKLEWGMGYYVEVSQDCELQW